MKIKFSKKEGNMNKDKWLWVAVILIMLVFVCVDIFIHFNDINKIATIGFILIWYCLGIFTGIQIKGV